MATTYNELRTEVDKAGGLLPLTMEDLRDIHGAGRLGVHVRQAIAGQLASHGLGSVPEELPSYQEEEIRVYRLGTPIADVINAVLQPSPAGDQVLLQSAGSEASDLLKQIRQLVCD